jgi:hypothetical protein
MEAEEKDRVEVWLEEMRIERNDQVEPATPPRKLCGKEAYEEVADGHKI